MKISKLFTLMAAAAMMLTTACSSDEPVVTPTGSETSVTFTVDLPSSISNRARTAYADGTTATRLTYAIYHQESDGSYKFVLSKSDLDIIDRQAQVTLNMLSGENYAVAFWAAAKDAPYSFNFEDATMTVNYDEAVANDEKRDAFYACAKFTATANASRKVTLTRPFAQLNIGTSDFEEARRSVNFVAAKSSVSVEGYDQLDLISGEAKGECTTRDFALNERPQGEKFPVEPETYDYLSMVYVLMPASDQIVSDVVLKVQDTKGSEQERDYTNIPMKRNYRTNIYGELLTSTNVFNVTINPYFGDGDEDESDGNINKYVVSTISLRDFAQQCKVAGNIVDFYDVTSTPEKPAYFSLPAEIAEGVTINAHGANLCVSSSNNVISSDNVTIVDANIMWNGDIFTVTGNGFVAENCNIMGGSTQYNKAVDVGAGVEATFKNCTFSDVHNNWFNVELYSTHYGIYSNTGATVYVENCDFGDDLLFAYNSDNGSKLYASGCTFHGWMSGWQDGGEFTDCTFMTNALDSWYPVAVCYGDTKFTNCKFEYVGRSHADGDSPLDNTKYGYDYIVSGRGPSIYFENCTWISTLVPEYNGKAVDSTIYRPNYGDDKSPVCVVYIDGEKVIDNESAETIRRRR
jgi:hypothetical protein